jgi:non-heme Fe2+,alpha-ketoglutarate-dependent halogenase
MKEEEIKKQFSLTDEELKQFKEQGYLGPFDLYSKKEAKNLWKNIRIKLSDRSNNIYSDVESSSGATNLSNYDRHFDIQELSNHISRPEIVDRVSDILGNNVMCWRTEFFSKYKGDEGTDWHQSSDFSHASGKPQFEWNDEEEHSGGTITVWCALTNVTKKNGALQVIPGTHKKMNYDETKTMDYDPNTINKKVKDKIKRGFFGSDYRQLQIDPNWKPEEEKAIAFEMKAGQFIIFWSTLMHASYPHTSTEKDIRMAYVGRYLPNKVKVYPEMKILKEYGGAVDLSKHGSVQVSGKDEHNHNKMKTENIYGVPFIKKPSED